MGPAAIPTSQHTPGDLLTNGETLSMATQQFSKFVRPETGPTGPITDRDLDIFDAILRYRFCSAAQIVRLAGGNEDVTHRRLRRLWERGLVARWAVPGLRTHSEFYYYLDSREPIWALPDHSLHALGDAETAHSAPPPAPARLTGSPPWL
jgi:hypothetical protein